MVDIGRLETTSYLARGSDTITAEQDVCWIEPSLKTGSAMSASQASQADFGTKQLL